MKPVVASLTAVVIALALMAACTPDPPAAWEPPTDRGTTCTPVWIASDNREAWKCWPA